MHYKKFLDCYLCKKHINGKYYFDWAGHNICASHINEVVKCASCGQFCNSEAKEIGLGLKICKHCQKYRIERNDSNEIVLYVKNIFRLTAIGEITRWHLKVIDAETLFKLTKDINTRGLAQSVGKDYTIYIYRELSRVAFAQVLAHEMLHVYQYINNIKPSKAKCEGFCNLGSYVVLKSINNLEAKAAISNLENSPDPIYGDGFRLLLSTYQMGGWEAAIRLINEYK